MWINNFLLLLISSFTVCELSIRFPEEQEQVANSGLIQSSSTNHTLEHHVANLGISTLAFLHEQYSNVIVSPFNIYSFLRILHKATAGETRQQISKVLGLTTNSSQSPNLDLDKLRDVSWASAAFISNQSEIKASFVNESLENTEAKIISVDFTNGKESTELINRWVSEQTNGTIRDLLQEPLESTTKSVVVSTLTFNGLWEYPFKPDLTFTSKFHVSENETVEAPFMSREATFPILTTPYYQAVGLPYKDNNLTMYIILPRKHGRKALDKVISLMTPEEHARLQHNSTYDRVTILIPKLKIDVRFELSEPLKNLGISSIFNPEESDFSNLFETERDKVFISHVYHNVHFEMNEYGTEAAAATAGIINKSLFNFFRASRPFLFVIMHNSGLPLFTGVITRPY